MSQQFGPTYPSGAGHSRGRFTPTSEKAARSIDPNRLSALQTTVLARLLCAGEAGATVDELVEQTALYRYSLAPRLNELHRLGWIEDTGLTRRTPRGGESIVWRALSERRAGALDSRRQRRQNALELRIQQLEEQVAELRRTIGGAQRRLL